MKKLFFLAVVAAIAAGVLRLFEGREQWRGLTESEARAKFAEKVDDRLPADQMDAIATTVIGKLVERGFLSPDEPSA